MTTRMSGRQNLHGGKLRLLYSKLKIVSTLLCINGFVVKVAISPAQDCAAVTMFAIYAIDAAATMFAIYAIDAIVAVVTINAIDDITTIPTVYAIYQCF